MRLVLLTLLMLFCLPLQWAGAAEHEPCVHELCASAHATLTVPPALANTDDHLGESYAQHSHCGSCHSGALALPVCAPFVSSDEATRLHMVASLWTEVLLVERPERPQWPTLA
ncbi:hypothetical protein [Hydrogenophaga pseudoflava]|jgi:hypothetical protein|uniref:hypothetical protein n=1 Tax=Hydrogenophaga pseudoflava TaxID=47421 RepID=UPI0027E4F3B8|nr:hypothetical protein [Hydrogenophaga pseudoflava]MDQ7744557.1 hypothetical protein [Hydrogenophaga pseudoflava]